MAIGAITAERDRLLKRHAEVLKRPAELEGRDG
jgi:hypothetical protein